MLDYLRNLNTSLCLYKTNMNFTWNSLRCVLFKKQRKLYLWSQAIQRQFIIQWEDDNLSLSLCSYLSVIWYVYQCRLGSMLTMILNSLQQPVSWICKQRATELIRRLIRYQHKCWFQGPRAVKISVRMCVYSTLVHEVNYMKYNLWSWKYIQ